MAAPFFTVEAVGLGPALAKLNALAGPGRASEALPLIGALIENQTKARIAHEKTSPDGEAWPAWSERYAASRHHGHSLLQAEGHLLDSIAWTVEGEDELQVGSNLVYAAIQQFGGTEGKARGAAAIPARAYLGLSDQNISDIERALDAWIAEPLQ